MPDSKAINNDENLSGVQTVIILPRIVSNYAEGRITVEDCDHFMQILAAWYYNQLHQIYVVNDNIIYSAQGGNQELEKVQRDF